LRERIGFGVLLIREGAEVGGPAEPFTVGTVTRIISANELDDGRMNILTMGMVRFRLLKTHERHAYLSGDIETWEDEMGDTRALPQLTKAAHRSYIHYVAELAELMDEQDRQGQIVAPLDPQILSYTIASNIQIPNEVAERLARELELLEAEQIFLQRVKLMRETFARNDLNTFSQN
jgi:Lon protease-like protein